MEDVQEHKRDFPKMHKLKEEYSTMAPDLNFVLLWMQVFFKRVEKANDKKRELLASQTLSDLALNSRGEKEEADPNRSQILPLKETQEEQPSPPTEGDHTWGMYIPPSKTTSTTLETINNTERTVLSTAPKIVGDDMMDIAQALEDLSCDKKRSMDTCPKPKKRRRRRHEIARNFKCSLHNCTKSYGSEGALKTHIRLKHNDNNDHKKKERESKTAPWANAVTAGLSPVVLPQLPVFRSLAGDSLPSPMPPPSFHHNPLLLQPKHNQLPSFNSLLNNINTY
jgi:hypothetical protein